jgi:chaperonin GroEL (HSP60 family)
VDGDTGKVVDMKVYGLLESASVKIQTLKTAIEVRITHGYALILLTNQVCNLASQSGRHRCRATAW